MSDEETAARYRQVLAWRDEGLTYRAIGERLGVGPGRAVDLYRAALRWRQRLALAARPTPPHPTADMPVSALPISAHAKRTLQRQGLRTLGEVAAWSDTALLGIDGISLRTVRTIAALHVALATVERQDL